MWKSAYNSRPNELKEGTRIGKVVVAVIGAVDDWAAYELEIVDDEDAPRPNDVATNGDKIGEEEARKLFPVCRNLKYRP